VSKEAVSCESVSCEDNQHEHEMSRARRKCKSDSSREMSRTTLAESNLNFNPEWTNKYMCICLQLVLQSLMCGFLWPVKTIYYLLQHYSTNHSKMDTKYPLKSLLRIEFISTKPNEVNNQQLSIVKGNKKLRSTIIAVEQYSVYSYHP